MENGSKALIIAGAILLAILIIGLGVFIYNQASNTVGETGMDQVAIRKFNGQFEQYLGKIMGAPTAKALIDTVKNASDLNHNINLSGINNKNQIITGHKYTVKETYSNGIISDLLISDVNESISSGDDNGSSGDNNASSDIDPLILAFNAQFSDYVPENSGFGLIYFIEPDRARELIDIIDTSNNSNQWNGWQVTREGVSYIDSIRYRNYEIHATYNDEGRIIVIGIYGGIQNAV